MDKQIIATDKAPKAVGPYSQAVRFNDLIFISGQISQDVRTGKVIRQNVAAQTDTVMTIIQNMLEEQGTDMNHVLKCTVHLSDSRCFDEMNKAYSKYFREGNYPSRLTVSGVQLFDGVDVEIDVIAGIGTEKGKLQ